MKRVVGVGLALAAAVASAGRARAQGLDVERFAPAAGAAGGLQVERPLVPAHLGYGLGLLSNYSRGVAVLEGSLPAVGTGIIDHAVSADLMWSLGLFDLTELAVHLPLRLVYAGPATRVDGEVGNVAEGLTELRLVPKVASGWVGDGSGGGMAYGVVVPVTLPLGRPDYGGTRLEPRALVMFAGQRWALAGSLGFLVHGSEARDFTFGVAATLTPPLAGDRLEVQLELIGSRRDRDPGPLGAQVPLEALAAAVYHLNPSWSLCAGGGVGLTDGLGMPTFRLLAGLRHAVGLPRARLPIGALIQAAGRRLMNTRS